MAYSYVFPLPGWSGKIEPHWGVYNGACDLMASRGWPVVSVTSGTVESAGTSPIGGNNVMIRGDDTLEYYYAHFDSPPLVQSGQRVQAGSRIGAVGNTGDAAGGPTHLHIGIGHSIMTGADAKGGAGDIDCVKLLQQIYSGQTPETITIGIGSGTTADGGGGILGGITDPIAQGIGQFFSLFFAAFTKILRG